MSNHKIQISELKGISILYNEDVYDLAQWLLRLDLARTTPTRIPRHTIYGLANRYAYLTQMDKEEVLQRLAQQGVSLDATIEPDEDLAQHSLHFSVTPNY